MGGSRIAVRTVQILPEYMRTKIIENDINRCNRLSELVDDGDLKSPALNGRVGSSPTRGNLN